MNGARGREGSWTKETLAIDPLGQYLRYVTLRYIKSEKRLKE